MVAFSLTYQLQDAQHRIDMPPLVWSEAISRDTNLRRHDRLELIVCNLQECQQLSYQYPHIAFVDQRKTEVKGSPPNTDIRVSETVKDRVPMSLHSIGFDRDYFVQSVESDVSDVVVPV